MRRELGIVEIMSRGFNSQSAFASLPSGLVGSGSFIAFYYFLGLIWPVALLLSVVVYFGVDLVLRPSLGGGTELRSSDGRNKEIEIAAEKLAAHGERLRAAHENAPNDVRLSILEMSENVLRIREILLISSTDFRSVKSFINVFLPRIVETVETYVRLTGQSGGSTSERLASLSESIAAFSPTIERIRDAALESDLRQLEAEVAVLSDRFPEMA